MSNNEFIKVTKLSDGSLDPMGLPFWEYKYINKSNIEFEVQVWFQGNTLNEVLYNLDCSSVMVTSFHAHCGGTIPTRISTPVTYPDRNSPKYINQWKSVSRDYHELINPVKINRFFISGTEVSENEFERVASLVGCKL